MRVAVTWKMKVLDPEVKVIRTLYFCRVKDAAAPPDDRYVYFGPSASPDMPGYAAHKKWYPEQITIRYALHPPKNYSLQALKTLVQLSRELNPKKVFVVPSVTSSK